MKKRAVLFMGLSVSICLAGCTKLLDYLEEHGGGGASKNYRISRFIWYYDSTHRDSSIMYISYNSAGNPVSELQERGGSITFDYDLQGRVVTLTQYPEPNMSSAYRGYVHRYTYDGSNRIYRDSSFVYSIPSPGNPNPGDSFEIYATYYTYDVQNRITQAILDSGNGHFWTQSYSYDTAGDLTHASAGYDNKTNFRTTNKLWQFLDRDYSKHNPDYAAYTYNDAGLPVTLRIIPSNYYSTIHWLTVEMPRVYNYGYNDVRIDYEVVK